jgi:hypothetical protein
MIKDIVPSDYEAELASNAYIMSLVSIIAGFPLPFFNLLATVIFFLLNRSYFVRWHTTQAMLSQLIVFFINSFGFWWTISIIFWDEKLSIPYILYLSFILIFNIIELIATIYAAIETRKGQHSQWWVLGGITSLLCKP